MLEPIIVYILERKRLKKIPLKKHILFILGYPIFDIVGRWTTYIALFKKIEWKPVPHQSKITIEDIENQEKIKSLDLIFFNCPHSLLTLFFKKHSKQLKTQISLCPKYYLVNSTPLTYNL